MSKYRNQFDFIKRQLEQKGTEQLEDLLSEIAVVTHTPIIVVYYYAGEILGFSDEINAKIESLKKYYGYEEIVL